MFKRLIISILTLNLAYAQPALSSRLVTGEDFNVNQLPAPGAMVGLSAAYDPVLIKGIKIHPENPLLFDFIIDSGHSALQANNPQLRRESEKLIKYFLATVTIPENDLWVNLSPYEKNRMIPAELGQTELGRDMLAEDYMLKQLTASLIYPEKDLGKDFWDRVYTKARQRYNTTQIPVNTFNKVWILADKAKVYVQDNTAFIIATHLKVMLEEDYLAMSKHTLNASPNLTSQIVRELILPEIEKEVNNGKNFAPLRQIFYSMILATWYKKNLKEALLNQVYANKSKINGVDVADKTVKDKIYQKYLQAYKKGVFNYIKDDQGPNSFDSTPRKPIARKYFSGGLTQLDKAQVVQKGDPDLAMFVQNPKMGPLFDIQAGMKYQKDAAMHSAKALDIGKPVLEQIDRWYLDNKTANYFATEFVRQILRWAPDSAEGKVIKKAIEKSSNKKYVIKAFRDYFIEGKESASLYRDRHFTNWQIVTEALSWMYIDGLNRINLEGYFQQLNAFSLVVTVTGSTGGLATPFIYNALEKYGTRIVSFQRNLRDPQEEKELQSVSGENLTVIFGDLRDKGRIIEALGKAKRWAKQPTGVLAPTEAVVHLGGISEASMHNPAEIFLNITNTNNLLEAIEKEKVRRFFFASTLREPYTSPYAMGKSIEEKMIRIYSRKRSNFKFVILRFPNVAGSFPLGEKVTGDKKMRLVPALLNSIRNEHAFTVTTDGKTEIGFIDFEDVAELIKRSLAYLGSGKASFIENVVPYENYTLDSILAKTRKEGTAMKGIKPPGNKGFLKNKLDWEATKDFDAIWKEALKLPGPSDFKKPSQYTNYQTEALYMSEVFQTIMNPAAPFSDRDRLEFLLGVLIFSIHSTEKNLLLDVSLLNHTKINIFSLFQNHLKGYDPDENDDFLDRLIGPDEKIFKLFTRYKKMIKDEMILPTHKKIILEGQELYVQHIKYLQAINRLWSGIKKTPDPAMTIMPAAPPGGIDLNARNLHIEIGKGSAAIKTHFDIALGDELKKGDFSGFVPVILNITPMPKTSLQNIFARSIINKN